MAHELTPKHTILEAPSPVRNSENVYEQFSIMRMHAYGAFEVTPKEESQGGQGLRMIAVCMVTRCTPLQPAEYSLSSVSR